MQIKFFRPGLWFDEHEKEMMTMIRSVLHAGDLILRGDVENFEQRVADFVGARYCVGLNSGTDALYLALLGLGIGLGDEVLVPSYTFKATIGVIEKVGAIPVLYDLDGEIEKWINETKVKAIIPVHMEGAFDTNFQNILTIAQRKGWKIIEDAAQAFGADYEGKKAGSFGHAGCFSFYPAKTLGSYGDAGALVTNNLKLYEFAREARNHFKNTDEDWGINSRLDNLQAAILLVKFKHYKEALEKREAIATEYRKQLKGTSLGLPTPYVGRIWQDYIVRCKDNTEREALYSYLKNKGIETLRNEYPFPIKKLPLDVSYESESLRLPCNETMVDAETDYVVKTIRAFYAR